jgi:ParB family chromosome partitioning protein
MGDTGKSTKPMQHAFKRTTVADQTKILAVTKQLNTAPSPILPTIPAPVSTSIMVGSNYSSLQPNQVIDAPVKDIKRNPYNARQIVTMEGLDQLAISLRRGQETAALAFVDSDGNLCLIDGHRRLEASLISDLPTLRVEIRPRPENDQELYLSSRRANDEREGQSPIDDALSWKKLIDKGVFKNQNEIAQRLGIDEGIVSKTFNLTELPSSVVRSLADKPELLNLRMLTAIRQYWKASDDIAAGELILEIEKNNLSSRDVDKKRSSLEHGKSTRVRGVAVPKTFAHGSAVLKRFDDKGTFSVEISAIKDEKRMELLSARINAVLEEVLDSEQIS